MLSKAKLYYHTIKWLRWEQIVYRIYYRFAKPKVSALEEYPAPKPYFWNWSGLEFLEPSLLSETEAIFLNEKGAIASPSDWNNPEKEKLWLYNLHYFDDLNAKNSTKRREEQETLMRRWVDENPPTQGNGWEPYPLSLRIVNWVKWLSKQQAKDEQLHQSLFQQADVLRQQLEYHILGNHLFANAKALVFVGAYFDTPSARNHLQKGLKILNEQLKEQFLADGGHFERSPMYHCILLNDLLELIDLSKISGNKTIQTHQAFWRETANKAQAFLQGMLHPDNEISFFNDAACGIAPSPSHISNYAAKLGLPLTANEHKLITFKNSGYSRLQNKHNVLLFDHGDIGPDYLPGHAHADTLSFEWSHIGQRIVVNSGTSLYGVSKERLRQRQTPAHSTVTINNLSSSEVWGGFRVARRAKGELINTQQNASTVTIEGKHNGYYVLGQNIGHTRKIELQENKLNITDTLDGNHESAEAYFHLHPSIRAEIDLEQANKATLTSSDSVSNPKLTISVEATHPIEVIDGTWHPEFGESIQNQCLLIRIRATTHQITFFF